jgi:hypothetical protein
LRWPWPSSTSAAVRARPGCTSGDGVDKGWAGRRSGAADPGKSPAEPARGPAEVEGIMPAGGPPARAAGRLRSTVLEASCPNGPLAARAVPEDERAGVGSGTSSAGDWARLSPSRSALRRTRSAWASSMLEEWLFTPIPMAKHSSSPSLLVRPSSRASSYTRIFLGKLFFSPFVVASCLRRQAVRLTYSILPRSPALAMSASTAGAAISRRSAREKARFRLASAAHAGSGTCCPCTFCPNRWHNHAPRPGAERLTSREPSTPATTLTRLVAVR